MRLTEILSMRREHLDLEHRLLYIPVAKAGAREQPLTGQLTEYLRECLATFEPGQEFFFPSKRTRCGYLTTIHTPFRRVVTAAGMDPKQVVRHTLRHTAITHLVQAGIDLPTVQRISGHKTLLMVTRYAHQNGEHIQKAMDTLEARYNIEL